MLYKWVLPVSVLLYLVLTNPAIRKKCLLNGFHNKIYTLKKRSNASIEADILDHKVPNISSVQWLLLA